MSLKPTQENMKHNFCPDISGTVFVLKNSVRICNNTLLLPNTSHSQASICSRAPLGQGLGVVGLPMSQEWEWPEEWIPCLELLRQSVAGEADLDRHELVEKSSACSVADAGPGFWDGCHWELYHLSCVSWIRCIVLISEAWNWGRSWAMLSPVGSWGLPSLPLPASGVAITTGHSVSSLDVLPECHHGPLLPLL